jgi:hypothetical protein
MLRKEIIMNQKYIEDEMTETAAQRLRCFGYKDCNIENIFTVTVFRLFFKEMLKDTKENHKYQPMIISACDYLLNKISEKESS